MKKRLLSLGSRAALAAVLGAVGAAGCSEASSSRSAEKRPSSSQDIWTLAQKDPRLRQLLPGKANPGWGIDGDHWTSINARDRNVSRPGLLAEAPATATGNLAVRIPSSLSSASASSSSTFTLRALGARPVLGALHEGRVEYASAYGDAVDLVALTSPSSAELLLLLRDASAASSFSWVASWNAGIARARRNGDGSLGFESAAGSVVFRIPPPYAVDATGARRSATLAWDDGARRIDVHLDTQGLVFPVLLDPAIESSAWELTGPSTARNNEALAYDAARGRLLLFGGYAYGPLADTWTWDGVTWSQESPANRPPARSGHSMAFDAARGQVLLFGGAGTTGPLADTWIWDGSNWTNVTTTVAPPARQYGAMAYDAARARVVLFGGLSGTAGSDLGDTWTWDGASWTQATTAVAPAPRSRHVLAYDAARANTVLFSGVDDSSSTQPDAWTRDTDTWTWDGATWTQHAPATSPSGREYGSATYDAALGGVVLFGGVDASSMQLVDLWLWNGAAWTARPTSSTPPVRTGGAIGTDATGSVVLFGGYGAGAYKNDTWRTDGSTWTEAVKQISPRYGDTSVYDANRGQVLVFGGSEGDYFGTMNDLWAFDGTSWSTVTTNAPPPTRFFHVMAYDSARAESVVFGGYSCVPVDQCTNLSDTWTLKGSTWTQVSPAHSPSSRYLTAIDNESTRSQLVLFGGNTKSDETGTTLADTWTWNGTDWTQLSPATSPSARFGHGMAFDPSHGVSVLFGGFDPLVGYRNDTWTFDGTTWRDVTPALGNPGTRFGAQLTFDSRRQRVVMYGGYAVPEYLHDTWSWDGTSWTSDASTLAPGAAWCGALSFDDTRGNAVYMGGTDNGYVYGDTWILASRSGRCTADSQCDTGHCTDGVCCSVAACGTCASCAVVGNEGACQPVDSAPDPDSCSGTQRCDANAYCKAANGQTCTSNGACASAFCVDGVCCESACAGTCQACSTKTKASGPDGVCGLAANGNDPHGDCDDEGSALCAYDGQCNGAGACRLYGAGIACGSASCKGNLAIGRVCDGAGTCETSAAGVACAPYACDVTAGGCANPCQSSDECTAENYCADGACKPRGGYGATCHSADNCPIGASCVDGVCCNSPCASQCESCSEPNFAGTCIPVSGAPRGQRPACGASVTSNVCGAPACDGETTTLCAGLAGAEVVCSPASCSDGIATLASDCTGEGTCASRVLAPCTPYVCAGTACATSCASDADCVSVYRCDGASHRCVARQGASCDGDHLVVTQGGAVTDCTPYRCGGSSCLTTCGSIEACVDGFVCDQSGACVPPTDLRFDGGCSVVRNERTNGNGEGNAPAIALALACLAFVRARASRRSIRLAASPSSSRCR